MGSGCTASHRFTGWAYPVPDPIYFCELGADHDGDHRALIARPNASEVQWPNDRKDDMAISTLDLKITADASEAEAAIDRLLTGLIEAERAIDRIRTQAELASSVVKKAPWGATTPDGFTTATSPKALYALEQLRAESELLHLILDKVPCNLSKAHEPDGFSVLVETGWVRVTREQYRLFETLVGRG